MKIFGVLAHTEKAQAAICQQKIHLLASSFPRDLSKWWVDPHGRLAIFDATVIASPDGPLTVALDSSRAINLRTLVRQKLINNPAQLDGDFALASWDGSCLTLARDHFGQRQLYLARRDDVSLFCSDLEPLLEERRWQREIDWESAVHYLARGLAPTSRTLAKAIQSIPAAHVLRWTPPAAPVIQRYWTPLITRPATLTREVVHERIKSTLHAAIESRVLPRANALLLSGGVDSSYLAAYTRRITRKPLTAYTITYDPRYRKNEDHFAAAVAREIGAEHVRVSLSAGRAYSILRQVLKSPVPCSAWAAIIHQRLLAAISKRNEATLLSGLGADELFGGYDRYLDYYFRQREFVRRWRWPEKSHWFEALLNRPKEAAARLFPGMASFFSSPELQRWLYQSFAATDLPEFDRKFYRECRQLKPESHIFELMIAHECRHRIPDLLMTNFEPIAHKFAVPTSYPFLDRNLVSWASLLEPAERYWYENENWWAKKFFRGLAAELLPQSIVMRRRATYEPPIVDWFQESSFGPPVLDRFASTTLWEAGFLRRRLRDDLIKLVRKLPESYYTKRQWLEEFWAVLTLGAWYDRYIARIR